MYLIFRNLRKSATSCMNFSMGHYDYDGEGNIEEDDDIENEEIINSNRKTSVSSSSSMKKTKNIEDKKNEILVTIKENNTKRDMLIKSLLKDKTDLRKQEDIIKKLNSGGNNINKNKKLEEYIKRKNVIATSIKKKLTTVKVLENSNDKLKGVFDDIETNDIMISTVKSLENTTRNMKQLIPDIKEDEIYETYDAFNQCQEKIANIHDIISTPHESLNNANGNTLGEQEVLDEELNDYLNEIDFYETEILHESDDSSISNNKETVTIDAMEQQQQQPTQSSVALSKMPTPRMEPPIRNSAIGNQRNIQNRKYLVSNHS